MLQGPKYIMSAVMRMTSAYKYNYVLKVIGGVSNLHHGVYDVDTSKTLGGEQSLLAGSQLYVVACTL